ncbi:putative glycoside hydrolase family 16 protein [Phaeoacremonium minimum UCRPA7]|uniref:endo-1,3(4)-beta-glucanase n=1 Tax=Phaeoacremonium minimum (strain UCR-PA7) TaxID=1286976 RepID=R8BQA8_PHAM7|nr:putative glycoside hydrolase family 16 protein [Phaeoacremonium minimum UCRPA7]EOO01541.1 putative glycoside hydrolase family 16 protein [Phaeoacremonium minimum UCRPA7]
MTPRLGRGHGRPDKNGGISLAQMDLPDGPPPAYTEISRQTPRTNMGANHYNEDIDRWYNPRTWRKRIWAILVAIIVIIIVVVVAVVVTLNKQGAYPNYTNLTYTLSDTYSGETFFDNFNYFHDYDPSSGFVHYVSIEDAERLNLTYASSSTAVVKVDTSVGNTSTPDASTGRYSVRVHSKTQYNSGLFIFDVKHTPYGCATWPALWLTDPDNWPDHGEIDVMEAVNQATDGNEMTLHTTDGCKMNHKRKMTGSALKTNCDHDANDNAGCGVEGDDDTYGETFNSNGGGVMALEWRDAGIRVWQFARDSIPDDITSGSPVPSSWGTALADFPNTGCDIGSHFKNQSIIVNIDLCGDLTNSVYSSSGCPTNCTDLVANYPDAFTNAYWEFGEFQIYQAS